MHKNLVHKNMVKMDNISSSVGGGQMNMLRKWAIGGVVKWIGEKVLHVHDQRSLRKCRVGAPHFNEGLGANKGK